MDNYLINKYINEKNDDNININFNFNFLIIVPSLSTGGGNYWSQLLIEHFQYLGWNINICPLNTSNMFYNSG